MDTGVIETMFAAYGFAFSLPDGEDERALPHWPAVSVTIGGGRPFPASEPFVLEPGYAAMQFREGWLEVHGGDRPRVDIAADDLPPGALVHPYLALPAAALAHWSGSVALHGGAVLVNGGAVAVLADKGGGKSTTMAAASAMEMVVLTDDLLVVRDGKALRGPRAIDLRPDAAGRMGGRPLGLIGGRERWRIDLPPAPPEAPLVAIVELVWGDETTLTRVRPADRIDVLARAHALGIATARPADLLDLAAIPTFELARPRGRSSMADVIDSLATLPS